MKQAYKLLQVSYEILGEFHPKNLQLLKNIYGQSQRHEAWSCQGHCLLDFAYREFCNGNFEEAELVYQNALDKFQKGNDHEGEGFALLLKEQTAYTRGEIPNTENIQRALRFLLESNQFHHVGDCYGLLAELAQHQGDYQRARWLFDQALPYYDKSRTKLSAATVYQKLAQLSLLENDLLAAHQSLQLALSKLQGVYLQNARNTEARCRELMGDIFLRSEEYDQAFICYAESLVILEYFEMGGQKQLRKKIFITLKKQRGVFLNALVSRKTQLEDES